MKTRALSGLVFIIIVVSAIVFHWLSLALLFAVISTIGLKEFYQLHTNKNHSPQSFEGLVFGLITYSLICYIAITGASLENLFLSLIGFSLVALLEMFRNKPHPGNNISITIFGIVYVSISFSLLIVVANYTGVYQYQIPLGILLLLWTGDTFAYLIGRKFGKHKLFERISPKKTWEGYIGGIVFTMITGYILSLFFEQLQPMQWIIIAGITGIFGTVGDLIESMMKRSANVKDSGNIMPGHGGVMDRFDGLLFILPIIMFYLYVWVW